MSICGENASSISMLLLDDSKQAFKCPVCLGIGDDKHGSTAEEKCDNVAVYYACHQKDAVCVSTKTNQMVIRDCFSKKYYADYIKPKCDATKGCQHAVCEESGCKAALSKGIGLKQSIDLYDSYS